MDRCTRVLIADADAQIRGALRAVLERMANVAVVGEAGDGHEAVELTMLHHPHVVLMDIGMPRLSGLDATARITRQAPRVRVIILSFHTGHECVHQALAAGARGYVPGDADPSELEVAIRFVSRGGVYVDTRLPVRRQAIGVDRAPEASLRQTEWADSESNREPTD